MLYGLAKHRVFTRLALAESLVSLSAIAFFTSKSDLWSAAIASTVVLILNRGLLTPMLLCRHLEYSVGRYMTEIASRPMGVGLVTSLALVVSRATWLPGDSLIHIMAAGAVVVDGENGILVGHWADDVARGIRRFLDLTSPERQRMGRMARHRVQRYNVDHFVSAWRELYESLSIGARLAA